MGWLARAKRRQPGVYAYRTRKHFRPFRTEWGYIGKSRNLDARDRCHAGKCGRHPTCVEKPWWDLKVRRYTIQLPWWLGWDWVTLSLETALIFLTRPRYNIAKNPWPHLTRQEQINQRHARDIADPGYRVMLKLGRVVNWIYRLAGIGIILVGIGGYLWTR